MRSTTTFSCTLNSRRLLQMSHCISIPAIRRRRPQRVVVEEDVVWTLKSVLQSCLGDDEVFTVGDRYRWLGGLFGSTTWYVSVVYKTVALSHMKVRDVISSLTPSGNPVAGTDLDAVTLSESIHDSRMVWRDHLFVRDVIVKVAYDMQLYSRKEVEDLRSTVAAQAIIIAEQKLVIEQLRSEMGELRREVNELRTENAELKKEVSALRIENAALRKELTEVKEELRKTKEELAQTKEKLAHTQKELAETRKELALIKAELAATRR